jgi:hypothetical protein
MKIGIDVSVTPERLVARTLDGAVRVDEPNVVALVPSRRSPTGWRIDAIGAKALAARPVAEVKPAVSVERFDPAVSAGVITWLGKVSWSRRRPQHHGLIAVFDRVTVHVSIEGYDRLRASMRQEFEAFFNDDHWMRWRFGPASHPEA